MQNTHDRVIFLDDAVECAKYWWITFIDMSARALDAF